jgi:hypothetical protein
MQQLDDPLDNFAIPSKWIEATEAPREPVPSPWAKQEATGRLDEHLAKPIVEDLVEDEAATNLRLGITETQHAFSTIPREGQPDPEEHFMPGGRFHPDVQMREHLDEARRDERTAELQARPLARKVSDDLAEELKLREAAPVAGQPGEVPEWPLVVPDVAVYGDRHAAAKTELDTKRAAAEQARVDLDAASKAAEGTKAAVERLSHSLEVEWVRLDQELVAGAAKPKSDPFAVERELKTERRRLELQEADRVYLKQAADEADRAVRDAEQAERTAAALANYATAQAEILPGIVSAVDALRAAGDRLDELTRFNASLPAVVVADRRSLQMQVEGQLAGLLPAGRSVRNE